MRDLTGRVCLVTGGTSGVGKAIATGLAELGADVTILSRNQEKGDSVAEEIRQKTGNPHVQPAVADLSSLASVRAFADRFRRERSVLHVLSNNAAVLPMRREMTEDGLETILAVNYLSHFLLTNHLLDLLKASAPSRVLTVSGGPGIIRWGRFRLEYLGSERRFHPLLTTIRVAAMKVAFSYELARRLKGTGVVSNTFHPGSVKSHLERHLPQPLRFMVGLVESLFFTDACPMGVHLASAAELEGVTGQYFSGMETIAFQPRWLTDDLLRGLWERSAEFANLP